MRRICFWLLLITTPAWPQTRRVLSLDESINIAFSKSYDAARLEQTLINSQMNLRAADASLKSSGELLFNSLPNFKDGERQRESETGFTFERERFVDFQAQLFVNQPVRFSDGTFSLVASFDRFQNFSTVQVGGPDIPGQEISEDFTNYSPQLSLQFRQPLFTINRLQTNHRKARLNLENTEQVYSRSQLDIVYNVTANFFGLFRAQKQYEIDAENVKQAEEAYRLANLKQQAGLLPEVEVLRLQVDLANARNSAAASQAALAEREDQFKLLIGIPVDDSIQAMTELTYQPVKVSLEKALSEALNRRTELHSDEIDIELSHLNVRETDAQTQIKGDLFLTYGIFKRDENFSDAFRDFDQDRSVTFSLTVPLWDWHKNSYEVQAAKATLENNRLLQKNRVEFIKQEIRTTVRNLHSSQQRIEITRQSEELAEKSYRISLLKFQNGDLSTQDLALEQNRLTQARVNSLNAITDYKLALSDLRRKTLWDFEKDEPVKVEVPKE